MPFPWLVVGALGSAAIAGALARVTRQYALAALAGGTAILYIHGWLYFHYTSDDAYISYRYARNLADGVGLVWNPGQHVEGYSNFSWVLTLAGLHKLGADIVLSGRWLGFALARGRIAQVRSSLRRSEPGRDLGRGIRGGVFAVLRVAVPRVRLAAAQHVLCEGRRERRPVPARAQLSAHVQPGACGVAAARRAAVGRADVDPPRVGAVCARARRGVVRVHRVHRSEEHTSELQSRRDLVCRLL